MATFTRTRLGTAAASTSATSQSLTVSTPSAVGDLLVAAIAVNTGSGNSEPSISDNLSGTWIEIDHVNGYGSSSQFYIAAWYRLVTSADRSGTPLSSVTFTFNGTSAGSSAGQVAVFEYGGWNNTPIFDFSLKAHLTGSNSTITASKSTAESSSNPDELALSFLGGASNGGTSGNQYFSPNGGTNKNNMSVVSNGGGNQLDDGFVGVSAASGPGAAGPAEFVWTWTTVGQGVATVGGLFYDNAATGTLTGTFSASGSVELLVSGTLTATFGGTYAAQLTSVAGTLTGTFGTGTSQLELVLPAGTLTGTFSGLPALTTTFPIGALYWKQGNTRGVPSGNTTRTLTVTNPPVKGQLLICGMVIYGNSIGVSTPSDNGSGGWTQYKSTGSNPTCAVWTKTATSSDVNNLTTITFSWSGSSITDGQVFFDEYDGFIGTPTFDDKPPLYTFGLPNVIYSGSTVQYAPELALSMTFTGANGFTGPLFGSFSNNTPPLIIGGTSTPWQFQNDTGMRAVRAWTQTVTAPIYPDEWVVDFTGFGSGANNLNSYLLTVYDAGHPAGGAVNIRFFTVGGPQLMEISDWYLYEFTTLPSEPIVIVSLPAGKLTASFSAGTLTGKGTFEMRLSSLRDGSALRAPVQGAGITIIPPLTNANMAIATFGASTATEPITFYPAAGTVTGTFAGTTSGMVVDVLASGTVAATFAGLLTPSQIETLPAGTATGTFAATGTISLVFPAAGQTTAFFDGSSGALQVGLPTSGEVLATFGGVLTPPVIDVLPAGITTAVFGASAIFGVWPAPFTANVNVFFTAASPIPGLAIRGGLTATFAASGTVPGLILPITGGLVAEFTAGGAVVTFPPASGNLLAEFQASGSVLEIVYIFDTDHGSGNDVGLVAALVVDTEMGVAVDLASVFVLPIFRGRGDARRASELALVGQLESASRAPELAMEQDTL